MAKPEDPGRSCGRRRGIARSMVPCQRLLEDDVKIAAPPQRVSAR